MKCEECGYFKVCKYIGNSLVADELGYCKRWKPIVESYSICDYCTDKEFCGEATMSKCNCSDFYGKIMVEVLQ